MATCNLSIQLVDGTNVYTLESAVAGLASVGGKLDTAPIQIAISTLLSSFWINLGVSTGAKYTLLKNLAVAVI